MPYRRLAAVLTLAASALASCSDGGCEPFIVYAQHRWPPDGAALRSGPSRASEQIGGFLGNTPILITGYVKAEEPAYPNNPAPFQGREWLLHAAGGYITSAAVRAAPIENFDPTGLEPDGGPPVVLPKACLVRS